MTPVRELQDAQVIELLIDNDPESERLIGHVEAALTRLRELAGDSESDARVRIEADPGAAA